VGNSMKVKCSTCNNLIDSEDINIESDTALCRNCDEVFRLSSLLEEQSSDSRTILFNAVHEEFNVVLGWFVDAFKYLLRAIQSLYSIGRKKIPSVYVRKRWTVKLRRLCRSCVDFISRLITNIRTWFSDGPSRSDDHEYASYNSRDESSKRVATDSAAKPTEPGQDPTALIGCGTIIVLFVVFYMCSGKSELIKE
jgi:hypothetical protein